MTVLCLKGNRRLDLQKNHVYPVVDVFQLGKQFGYEIRMVLQLSGRRITVYVPTVHKNKLHEEEGFNVNAGDPTNKAKLRFQGKFTVRNSRHKYAEE